MKTVPVGIWKRFQTYDLSIAPSIAGGVHEFAHNGCHVKIRLPGKPKRKDWRKNSSNIECKHYRKRSGRDYPVSYIVKSVDITIETGKSRKIPENSIGAVDHSMFNSRQLESLDKFTRRYEIVVDSAFERWLDVLRWKTGIHTICPYHETRQRSFWGSYLFDASTKRDFYRPPYRITVNLLKSVSKKEWRAAQSALENDIDVPIWHIYIAEAHLRRGVGDIRGFILDLAISIETMVRALMREYIVSSAAPVFVDSVGRTGLMQILDNWVKINYSNKIWTSMSDEIKMVKFVNAQRNHIMHRGLKPDLSLNRAHELAQAVLMFVIAGEKQLIG